MLDQEIVMTAIKTNPLALKYVGASIKADEEVIRAAVLRNKLDPLKSEKI